MAPGLTDQILERGSAISSERAASVAFGLFEEAIRHPSSPDRYGKLEENLRANELLGFIDPFIWRVCNAGLPKSAVCRVAIRLATESGPQP